jgi:signal transduction histidine kinase/ActR/RegA family two-component response regulator
MSLDVALVLATAGAGVILGLGAIPRAWRPRGPVASAGATGRRSPGEGEPHARDAETLLEIARAAGSTLDETELFGLITRRAASACGADHCTMYRYIADEAGEWITAAPSPSSDGTADEAARGKRRLQTVPFLEEAVRLRAPVCIADPGRDPRVPRAWFESHRPASLVTVPVVHGDRVLGLLTFEYLAGSRIIDAATLDRARALAEQVALATQNARLYADAEARRREAEVVAELAAAINASLDLDTVLARIAEGARELCRSEIAAIALRDPETDAMRLRYRTGPIGALPDAGDRESGSAEAWRYHAGVSEYAAVMRQEGVVTALMAEIRSEQGVEGLLYAGNRSPRPFTPGDKAILTRLSDHAAIAIRNGRLYADAQMRLSRMRRLAELGRLISSSLDYQQVLDFVTGSALELLNGDMARLWVVDDAAGVVRLAAHRERDAGPSGVQPVAEFPLGEGIVGWVIEHKARHYAPHLAFEQLQMDPEWIRAEGYVSQIAVPLVVGERPLGVLVVLTKTARRFSPEDEEALGLFASEAATALEHARLYQTTQRAYQELARTQEQLIHAQKMEAIGRLAGGVAHDFNNLLTVIRGYTELMLEELPPEAPIALQLGLIQRTTDRAAALTRQLLAFSRRQLLQPIVLDLNGVVAEMEKMLRVLIGEDVELVTLLDPALGRVRADAGQLEQVLMNLAVNARDAMPGGGRLTIGTANVALGGADARRAVGIEPGRYVALTVGDTGVGMDAATQARVFEPFFTTKGPGKGTGLGLATVYGIVQQSGGHVTVESAPGRGAMFTVRLPRVEEALEVLEPDVPTGGPRSGSETILLVEDEDEVRGLVRKMLRVRGYTVLEAGGGPQALELSRTHPGPIDLLVTDVVMPQMSGAELASRLTPLRPAMRVLYISGYTDDAIGHHGVLEPGVAFLHKPFTAQALATKVREALETAARAAVASSEAS